MAFLALHGDEARDADKGEDADVAGRSQAVPHVLQAYVRVMKCVRDR